jgi:hypothetical protein
LCLDLLPHPAPRKISLIGVIEVRAVGL